MVEAADERLAQRVGQSKAISAGDEQPRAWLRVQDSNGQLGRRVHADGQDYGARGGRAMECSVLCRLGQLPSAAVHWLAVRLARCLVSRTWVWRLAQLEVQRAPLRLPFVNASRVAAQGADRCSPGEGVLTSSPEQAIADALARASSNPAGRSPDPTRRPWRELWRPPQRPGPRPLLSQPSAGPKSD